MNDLERIVDDLTYLNYALNRDRAPEVSPERWASIYPNAAQHEARYQAEKAITKASMP